MDGRFGRGLGGIRDRLHGDLSGRPNAVPKEILGTLSAVEDSVYQAIWLLEQEHRSSSGAKYLAILAMTQRRLYLVGRRDTNLILEGIAVVAAFVDHNGSCQAEAPIGAYLQSIWWSVADFDTAVTGSFEV